MPKVLLVEEGGRGGVADYTSALAGGIARAGWEVTVTTAFDHNQPPAPAGVRRRTVYAYARSERVRRARLSKPLNGLLHAAAIAPLVALARRSDIVHLQGDGEWPPLFAATMRALRLTRRPLVWTPHNTFARGAAHAGAWAAMYGAADRVVVHARADVPAVPDEVRDRTVVIPHGEYGGLARTGGTAPDPAGARAALGLPAEAPVALLFGHLRPDKGLDLLLRAAAQVEGLHVLVAGEDGGALAAAEPLLQALGDRVVVREGFHSMEAAAGFFAAADVVALPYARASASGVLLLAYGFGRPVVVTPVGGLPEAVQDGATGWIAAGTGDDEFADALRRAVARGREALRECGEAGRRLSEERYSWDAIGARTAELYASVARRSS